MRRALAIFVAVALAMNAVGAVVWSTRMGKSYWGFPLPFRTQGGPYRPIEVTDQPLWGPVDYFPWALVIDLLFYSVITVVIYRLKRRR